nr:hypothetical protein Iba_chr03dCG3190 [Ipomoea batatas]
MLKTKLDAANLPTPPSAHAQTKNLQSAKLQVVVAVSHSGTPRRRSSRSPSLPPPPPRKPPVAFVPTSAVAPKSLQSSLFRTLLQITTDSLKSSYM